MFKEVDQIAFRQIKGDWQLVTAFATVKAAFGLLVIVGGLCLFTPLLAKGQSPENVLLSGRGAPQAMLFMRWMLGVCLAGRLMFAPQDELILAPPAFSTDASKMTFETLGDNARLGITVQEQGGSILYRAASDLPLCIFAPLR